MESKTNMLSPYEGQFDIATRKRMVAEMLCELRKNKGLQQKEVAEILGISPQTYNGYEKGRNEPPIEILVRTSYLYDIPVDILVQRDRMHSYDQSAIETVKNAEEQIAIIRKELSRNPMANNPQLQGLIDAIEALTDVSRELVEKNSL